MGSASSSAARVSEAPSFGSLASMGVRTLKKKPVLVLDPDELEQAHLLFQQGAAEQMGEFDPELRERAPSTLFGLAPLSDDDGVDRADPVPADELVEVELGAVEEIEEDAELPAPEKVLALTRPSEPRSVEQISPAKAQALPPVAERDSVEAEFVSEFEPLPELEAEPQTDDHPAQVQPFDDHPTDDNREIAPGFSLGDAAAQTPQFAPEPKPEPEPEPVFTAPPAQELPDFEPQETGAPEPVEPEIDAFDQQVAAPQEADETVIVFADEDDQAPPPPASPSSIATGTQSSLRARLVREDVSIARPEPTFWVRLMGHIRRIWENLTFR